MSASKLLVKSMALSLLLAACSSGGNGNIVPMPTYSISLDFERVETGVLNPFLVKATVSQNGLAKTGVSSGVSVTLGRGTRSAISEVLPGVYQFTVTPTQTGEHAVTVSYGNASITRTALVVSAVDVDWGQPMAVPGLVNTAGYEDGVTVTADGEYLFVQYGPWYFSATMLFSLPTSSGGCGGNRLLPSRCTHPWLDTTIGPYAGPERPGFFDGRITGTTNLHNANSWGLGVDEAPIFAPSTMFYGFKRQTDGSFAQPFYIAFDDANDALSNPYGLSFLLHGDGTATTLFSFDDPTDPDMVDFDGNGTDDAQSLHDVFTREITLGQNNSLGTFVPSGTPGTPPVRSGVFPSQLVNFGKTGIDGIAGTQGNPHLHAVDGVVRSIWTDDERDTGGDRGDLSVYVLTLGSFPTGTWTKVVLPGVVNLPSPIDEIQPFFTGSGLYFTRGSDVAMPEVYYSAYSGTHTIADLQNGANWGTPKKIITAGTADSVGKIIAIGEPTIATIGGTEYLYFVYGYIRGYDGATGLPDIDMQAGFIKKK